MIPETEIDELRVANAALKERMSHVFCAYCDHEIQLSNHESIDLHEKIKTCDELHEHMKTCKEHPLFKALAELDALKKPVEGVDAIESELETRKIACPKMAICDSCNQADICPNLIARKQLASLTARLKEAEGIIIGYLRTQSGAEISEQDKNAREYMRKTRALEQARKVVET